MMCKPSVIAMKRLPDRVLGKVAFPCYNTRVVSPHRLAAQDNTLSRCRSRVRIPLGVPSSFVSVCKFAGKIWRFSATLKRGHQEAIPGDGDEHWEFGARLGFNFNENFGLRLGYQMIDFEHEVTDLDFATWYVEPKFTFNENFVLKGAYYNQDTPNDPKAWRAIFEVKQEALKFTSLWLEYNKVDAGFVTPNAAAFGFIADVSAFDGLYSGSLNGGMKMVVNDATIWRIGAHQKWSDKWDTFLHYAKFDIDGITSGGFNADANNYSIGFNYHYTPAVTFSLAYDKFETDDPAFDDNMIHFRTRVLF